MAKLLLVRGLPGSGKSTYAKKYASENDAIHLEAAMYFTAKDGSYLFDKSKLQEAHKWCQNRALCFLSAGHDVVVSNTFSRHWEMAPYKKMGFEFAEITMTGEFENKHNCPKETIEAMRKRWEK